MVRRILVLAAHPDDEVLGCGGTLSLLSRAGATVRVVILGQGEASRRATAGETEVGLRALKDAARAASNRLGVESVSLHDLPDNAFDTVPLLDIVHLVEAEVADFAPDTIYTHHGGDLNIDHELTCRAVLTASRPTGQPVPGIYSFEVRSSTDWSDGLLAAPVFRPNVWQVLDDEALLAKRQALECYSREMRPWPHSRSLEGLEALSRHRGAQVGATAAEAFVLLRAVVSSASGGPF